jgi:hypothetical protein
LHIKHGKTIIEIGKIPRKIGKTSFSFMVKHIILQQKT